ncbi:MAG TPA: lipoate--protein ligase [Clostridia bacterium]|nr:lipoate--protein ligase [Clostridia bacterium]
MKIIISPSLNPYFNLALEEVLFQKTNEDYILLWRGSNSVVIGKNQNPFQETNIDFLKENKIDLARRISGGGTVFHDEGNINYTMIFNRKNAKFTEFHELMKPIVGFLKEKGVNTYITERNDMRYKDKKISGTAQYTQKNRILHHGTLLFNANRSLLSKSLKCKNIPYESNCVKSVPSKVINLRQVIKENISVEGFILDLKEHLIKDFNGEAYELEESIVEEAILLKNNKYSTWDWIIGYTPAFRILDNFTDGNHVIEYELLIRKGRIKSIKIAVNGKALETEHLIDKKYSEALICEASSNLVNKIIRKLV